MDDASKREEGAGKYSLSGIAASLVVFLLLATLPAHGATINVPGDKATVQGALDAAATGDEIIVAPGRYVENLFINGKNIYLRSSDPTDPAVVGSTILDGGSAGSVVVLIGNESSSCVVAGFTITRGLAPRGGGVFGNGAEATIEHCRLTKNEANNAGGAIASFNGTISDCTITSNTAHDDGGGLHDCNGLIESSTIEHNFALYHGGGLYECNGTIRDCTIQYNGTTRGGGLSNCGGLIEKCRIQLNQANVGGGLARCSGTIQNNVVWANTATADGGGLSECTGTIRNNTLFGNEAVRGSGISLSTATITNCIVWENPVRYGLQISTSTTPTYSCIENWTGGGVGNITSDPLLVAPANGDLRLLPTSPCVDAGGSVPLAEDFEGDFRPFDYTPVPRGDGSDFDIGCDEVTRPIATIGGVVFRDTDGDGYPDPGEPGLAGVSVLLDGATTHTTSPDGSYRFVVTQMGTHFVSEHDPAGYFSTTPNTVYLDVGDGESPQADFGDAPATSPFATVQGCVFKDADGDGIRDTGEMGIAGVSVAFDGATTTTGPNGDFMFRCTSAGVHSIVETDPSGYHSTTPNEVRLNVVLGQGYTVNFGDSNSAISSSVFGTVFHDTNVNGQWDPGEPGLAGATVTLKNASGSLTLASGVTNAWGQFSFVLGTTGTYRVVETDGPGYVSTDAVPGASARKVNIDTLEVDVLAMGQAYGGNAFGDVEPADIATITGLVWNDNGAGGGIAGNGLRDGSEPLLAGATMSLSNGLFQTTGPDGAFLFHGPTDQVTTLTVTHPTGYYPTNAIPGPNGRKVDNATIRISPLPASWTEAGILFGAASASNAAILKGIVFLDANVNGRFDSGESGLSRTTITLEVNGTNASTVLTDGQGRFSLAAPPATDCRISVTRPSNPAYYPVTPESIVMCASFAGIYQNLDFGYGAKTNSATIHGTVFKDRNVNAVWDPTESGLAGTTVTLKNALGTLVIASAVTNAWGQFVFTISATGTYRLVETDPSNYLSTNAIPGSAEGQKIDANTLLLNVSGLGRAYGDNLFADAPVSSVVTVRGVVWNDNGAGGGGYANGLRDGTEGGLAGALVRASSGMEVRTGSNGAFELYVLANQATTVTEVNPAGFVSTDAIPGTNASRVDADTLQVIPLAAGLVSQPNLFGDVSAVPTSIVTGLVYDDANENGLRDAGEAGIAGATVDLTIAGGGTTSALTDTTGRYQFTVNTGATVTIVSSSPGGAWYGTTTNWLTLTVGTPGWNTGYDFGYSNDPGVTLLRGVVFNDANADGAQEMGEAGIAGVTVTLDGQATKVTDSLGRYVFTITGGAHTIVETDPAGYLPSTPNEVPVNVPAGTSRIVDFGDKTAPAFLATISGVVYQDADGDGVLDAGETGIQGVAVSLDGVTTVTTNVAGFYVFPLTQAVAHNVLEKDPAGYFSTTPNKVYQSVAAGGRYRVDFGNAPATSAFSVIRGVVYADENRNGAREPGETALAGVTLSLNNVLFATTNARGLYTFRVTAAGVQTLRETDPPGYASTTPNQNTVNVAAMGRDYVVDFGDSVMRPGITIAKPAAGTVWPRGAQMPVAWTCAEFPTTGTLIIQLRKGGAYAAELGRTTLENGEKQQIVRLPTYLVPAGDYQIRVLRDGAPLVHAWSAYFTVARKPSRAGDWALYR